MKLGRWAGWGVVVIRWQVTLFQERGSQRGQRLLFLVAFGEFDDANEASGDYEYSLGVLPSEQWEFLQACLMNLGRQRVGSGPSSLCLSSFPSLLDPS